jgi:taurine dioxygenase
MTVLVETTELEPFGVEVSLDLSRPLTDEEQAELIALYRRHDLVLVRGQRLDLEEQIGALSCLGPVLRTPDSIGEVSRDSPIGLGGAELCFHADYAFSPEPILGISLHAIDVVEGETSTRFASGRRAYQQLGAESRRRCEEWSTLQVFGATLDRRNRSADLDRHLPRTEHPLVWAADDGGRFLFAPYMTTDAIVGLDPTESEQVIEQLFAALYGADNVFEHWWRPGDMVVWNNRSVTHARGDNTHNLHRVLQRVTLGTKGYAELYPQASDYDWEDGLLIEADTGPGSD